MNELSLNCYVECECTFFHVLTHYCPRVGEEIVYKDENFKVKEVTHLLDVENAVKLLLVRK